MKRIISIFLAALMLLSCMACFTSCESSGYAATMSVVKSSTGWAKYSFASLKGRYKLTIDSYKDEDVYLSYSASLEEGSIKVSYADVNDEEIELFTISSGETASGSSPAFTSGRSIKVWIETEGTAKKGEFEFSVDRVKK